MDKTTHLSSFISSIQGLLTEIVRSRWLDIGHIDCVLIDQDGVEEVHFNIQRISEANIQLS